ncbi:hypothetical protein CGZ96_09980 [Enemella evansiae]|uniref:DUF1707 SHOCT-like domain-containing protein n=1 Tax=Enemella evansiae TaxID=2016499 RepID=UPI000B9721F4|nr:DUF1707 domain-containing protein [Enemella evansiae]OYN98034.1 hypothetical protein CGZ96_09980 [Enemella evansiae]
MTAPMQPPFPFASFPRRQPPPPAMRVGDAERAEACELLNRHFTAGRLGHDEFEERLSTAVAARTEPELDRLFADLPQLPPPPPTPVPARPVQSHPVRDLFFALTMLGGLLAIPVVLLMLLGAMMFSPGVFLFSLVGGSLAAFSGATLTRMCLTDRVERHRSAPQPGGRQPLQP